MRQRGNRSRASVEALRALAQRASGSRDAELMRLVAELQAAYAELRLDNARLQRQVAELQGQVRFLRDFSAEGTAPAEGPLPSAPSPGAASRAR